jgi:hypothetical protein
MPNLPFNEPMLGALGGEKAAAGSALVEAQSGLELNVIRHTIDFCQNLLSVNQKGQQDVWHKLGPPILKQEFSSLT